MNPRLAALRVIVALENSPKRLESLLDQELASHAADQPRDRAMAASLVYAVLRHRLRLDRLLAPLVSRALAKLDPPVLAALRLGAADLVVLGSAAHGAVNGVVEAVKASPSRGAAGLVNGVLRALARSLPDADQAPPPADVVQRLSVQYSHPSWLTSQMVQLFGARLAEGWLAANQVQQPVTLRVNTLLTTPAELAAQLAPAVTATRPHPLAPEALVLEGARGPLDRLPGFAQGLWQAQDAGAQAISRLLDVTPGMMVLDLCAGAGGKTGHLAALMQNQGRIVAVDSSEGRLKALAANMARLDARIVEPVLADGLKWNGGGRRFDRILVDAPCTGLGVVGRRPDVRWRRQPKDCARMARDQLGLLLAAADLLAPGGALLYCTCSVMPTENEEVVGRLLAQRPELALAWPEPLTTAQCLGRGGFWRTYPQPLAADSFFAARFGPGYSSQPGGSMRSLMRRTRGVPSL